MRNHQREEQPLIVLDNLVTRDRIPVIYWENSIGRSKTSDIMLADQTVSRNHAVLYRREEGWMIADTGSKSGILLNGQKIDKRATVHVGDRMTLGTTTLVLQRAERPVKRRGSWFFDKRKKPSISPALLLFFCLLFSSGMRFTGLFLQRSVLLGGAAPFCRRDGGRLDFVFTHKNRFSPGQF